VVGSIPRNGSLRHPSRVLRRRQSWARRNSSATRRT